MKEYINFKKVGCKDCYKCLRNCPVKSMRFVEHQAEIIEEECILCGNCYLVCPQKAKEIRNDVDTVKALIKNGNDVYVSLAPSFIANYNVGIETMKKALMKLGFKDVEETAIGAEAVTHEYERILGKEAQDIVISTCCQSVNLLIRKYYPEACKYMAKVVSPMVAHAKKIKEEHPNGVVVFIGPCLSKKEEVDENVDVIHAALTFKELTNWLSDEKIDFEIEEEEETEKYQSRLYPIASGIIKTMKKNDKYNYITCDGLDKCKALLEEVLAGKIDHCFIEMSSCENSCVGGPGMDRHDEDFQNTIRVINYAGKDEFDQDIAELFKEYIANPVKKEVISDAIIKKLLAQLGKFSPSDELNCGSCGYNTCREKVIALYSGKSEPSMCLPYLKNKAMSYMDDIIENTPNGVIILNRKLEIELINKSACKVINVPSVDDVKNEPVERVLDKEIYEKVFRNKRNVYGNLSYLSEYSKYVEQTIIYNENFDVVMAIMRDITTEVKEKRDKEEICRRTMEVTDKVIEKQMRAVQEIASLLGETTAETKVALEKLKESLNDK